MALLDDLLAEPIGEEDDWAKPKRAPSGDRAPRKPRRGGDRARVQGKPESAVATANAPIATTDLSPVICKAQTTVRYPRDHADAKLRGKPILDADNKRQYRPCEARAMKGQEVCVAHGGRAPQAQAAAKLRLLAATEPLVAALLRIGLNETLSAADRTRAIVAALDRAGFRAGVELNVAEPGWAAVLGKLFGQGEASSTQDDAHVIEAEVVGTALTPEEIVELERRAGGERFETETPKIDPSKLPGFSNQAGPAVPYASHDEAVLPGPKTTRPRRSRR